MPTNRIIRHLDAAAPAETDHRPLALAELHEAVRRYWETKQRHASGADRCSAAALALEGQPLDDDERYERVRRWETWTNFLMGVHLDAERRLVEAVLTWEDDDFRAHAPITEPRAVALGGKLYVAAPDPDADGRAKFEDVVLIVVELGSVSAVPASGPRTEGGAR